VLGAVGGYFITRYWDKREHAKAIQYLIHKQTEEIGLISQEAENWVNALVMQQGENLLRAFTAGISPSVLAERQQGIELSSVSLLRIPGVVGIHVIRPNGQVVYSSDVKLTTTGKVDERGGWALTATDIISRDSQKEGIEDYALPIMDSGKIVVVVWLEYDLAGIINQARPSILEPPADSIPAESVPTDSTATPTP
nr:hypothetical protein [Candidatus Delongbacteria bacterium]